ncbi:MAG: glycoside-pentoside-hexuronide (GPH):cation symporter [Clostridiales bacterium]|nr:glycoside-pentoside-hexuronide (GPH):cation symporter [Clostridiales bacterium]
MSDNNLTHGIKFKDKIGYAMGDMGGLLTFSLIGAFQNKFYTDVLHISPTKIVVLILVARLWDAINDPIWGAFIDSRKPTKHGRFRPYIFWFSIPLAVSAVLMFTVIPGLSEAKYLLFAYITYIFYGMMYTAVNIPYGSLASVVTDDEKERSSLSMWRSIGAGVGGLPGTILLPMLVYTTTYSADGTKIQTLDGTKLTIGVLILSIISVVVYFGHYKLTKERIAPPEKQKSNYNAFKTIVALVKNRPFVMLCLASMLLIAFQFYYQSTYTYLFADYYHTAGLYSMVTVCTYLPMAILIPVMNKLIDKFGKKELCAFGMAFAAIVSFILFFIKTSSPYVFLVFTFFSGLGQTFLVLEVWALVMDVIDYHELRTHRREEGTAYAFFSFTRKLGQTLAGVGLNALLALIQYDSEASANGEVLSDSVLDSLYDISTLVPAVALALMAIILAFGYNLSKKKLVVMHNELEEVRQNEE